MMSKTADNVPIVLLLVVLGLLVGGAASQRTEEDTERPARANVISFGAVGDGIADDTAAIQRAVDSGIGHVELPKGIYRIGKPIVVDLDHVGVTSIDGHGVARLVMEGPGPALRLVGTHQKSADPQGFSQAVWDRQRMPLIDGLAIVGQHAEADGIEATGTMQLTISRVHVRQARHAIRLVGNNRNVIISDCHLYENRGVGIYYDDVNLHQSNITGCHISYNAGGGVVSRGGNVRNIHISGCDLESNMSPDAPPTANVLIDCRGSQYGTAEVAVTGCTLQHNNPSPQSANIRILGGSRPSRGLSQVREGNITISGNVLSDVQQNVHLKDCRGACLVGNTFWQGFSHNLLVEDCSNIVVGNNNFDRNPRYSYGNSQSARNGVVFRACEDCTLTGLHVNNVRGEPAGLLIEDCRRMNVTGCTILDCDNAGIWLQGVSDSRVSDCLIRDDRPQATSVMLRTTGGRDNMIVDNLLGPEPAQNARSSHDQQPAREKEECVPPERQARSAHEKRRSHGLSRIGDKGSSPLPDREVIHNPRGSESGTFQATPTASIGILPPVSWKAS